MKTFYLTFPFGARREIGGDLVDMWTRWVEVRTRSRAHALEVSARQFGLEGYQLHTEEAFTPDRRKHYPGGCCLILGELTETA